MHTRVLVLGALLVAGAVHPAHSAPAKKAPVAQTGKLFKGEWFDVRYPPDWTSKRGASSNTSATGTDSARFTSPDGSAEFYVYSPLWNGTPSPFDSRSESVVSRRTQVSKADKKTGSPTIRVVWTTTRARNGSYWRSVVDTENITYNTRRTFAFRYRDEATRCKYAPAFERFKASLRQYSD